MNRKSRQNLRSRLTFPYLYGWSWNGGDSWVERDEYSEEEKMGCQVLPLNLPVLQH